MFRSALRWFGLLADHHGHDHHGPQGDHGRVHPHGHTHGVIDPSIVAAERGIWAVKWSFAILLLTALAQFVVVVVSGSIALAADTIHNVGDATTAIPLWIAFVLARRPPNRTFTYGLGRIEDLAGLTVVAIILVSAIVAGYEAIDRFVHPRAIGFVWGVVAAGVVGFIGNEAVAVLRIRVGREMNSAALVADGYHARTDGLTSLAVVVSAIAVMLGFPLADPIIGLLITLVILGIVWQSGKAVFTRMLDGVEPGVIAQIRHAADHVPGLKLTGVKARWIGHKLHADIEIAVDGSMPVSQASEVSSRLEGELLAHIPAMTAASVRFTTAQSS